MNYKRRKGDEHMKKQISILLTTMILSLLFGSMTVYAAGFSISESKATLNIGDSIDLDVTGTDKAPKWTSYNVNIATVNQDGEVTAVRKGKTTISARIGLTYKKCTVTVVDSSIKLNKSAATIYTGGTSTNNIQLKATVKGANKAVVWTSDNEKVATVDNTGKVTSVSAGSAVITAKANGMTASCVITVLDSDITLNMDTMLLSTKGNGSSIKLVPTITGSKKTVKWTTSDKTIATVSGGKVTGKKTGTAVITAEANGVTATCEVTVVEGLISIHEEKVLLYTGETTQLKTNAAKTDVLTWTSLNEKVATVDNAGKVTAVSSGTATILVQCNGAIDTCEVTVKDTTTAIKEDTVELRTKGNDKTYTVNYEVIGKKTSVTWKSSDTKVATVSKGKITAKKAGSAVITATANGVSDTVTVTVRDFEPTTTLNYTAYTLYTNKGNAVTLKATVDGTSKTVTWESSNPSVATVNKGKVTALKAGQTLITASANGVSAECLITVRESRVLLETDHIHLDKGETAELPVDVIGTSQTIKYATTNSKVATVKNGVITAKAYGEADIKVTANGITALCHVTVAECKHTTLTSVVTKEPTCTEEGIMTYTCVDCGHICEEPIEKTSHDWEVTNVKDATCVNKGIVTYTCSICKDTKQEMTDTVDHVYGEWVVVTEPTEDMEGIEKQTCVVCGAENKRNIPTKSHEHSYEEEVTAPTCTEDGYTTYTCSCGDSYVDDTVKALGHDWGEWKTVKAPTEKEKGEEKRTCIRCGEAETRELPESTHEHKYSSKVIDPTCTEKGYTIYTCSLCKDTYESDYVDALGHDWGDWKEVTKATEKAPGEMRRTCNRCKETETMEIPFDHEHKYVSEVVKPTCTERGYTLYTCECGASYKDNYVKAPGHDWTDWDVIKDSTEYEEGSMTHSCRVCGQRETQIIPKKDHLHVYTSHIVTKPTCTEQGYTTWFCECGACYIDDFTNALGHEKDWILTKAPTCTEYGEEMLECSVCGETFGTRKTDPAHTFGDWQVTKTPASPAKAVSDFGMRRMSCKYGDEVIEQLIVSIDLGNGKTKEVYGTFDDERAYETLALVNEYRKEKGLKALKWYDTDDAEAVIKIRTAEIAYSDTAVRPNGSEVLFAENRYQGKEMTAKEAIEALGASKLAESSYTTYIASCFTDGETEYWVQMFTDADVSSTLPEHVYKVTDVVDATCTEDGYTEETCIFCGETREVDIKNAFGHTEGEWVVAKEAKLGVDGLKELRCATCEEALDKETIPMLMTDGVDSVYYIEVKVATGVYEQRMIIGHYEPERAAEMYELINEYRESIDMPVFAPSDYMTDYTDLRALECAYSFAHQRPNNTVTKYSENIAESYYYEGIGEDHPVQEIFEAWINSEGHRKNIEASRMDNESNISCFFFRVGNEEDVKDSLGYHAYKQYWVQTFS